MTSARARPTPATAKATILCADDDAVVRALLSSVLERAGYHVLTAEDGARALDVCRLAVPDLIILDIHLPGGDGFETFLRLRELPGMEETPILFLSSSTSEDHVSRGLALGAADYITKPIAPGVLRAKLQVFLNQDRPSQRLRKRPSSTVQRSLAGAPEEVKRAATQPDGLFDKYVLLDEVGAGSMGVVMRAWDTALRTHVALKFVRSDVDDGTVDRLYREGRHVIRLSHDHIVRVHDIREVDERHFIAMQYLEAIPAEGQFSAERAAELVEPIARAVHHAHERGIVHRDVKPANILIDADGKPWIGDFGISVSLRDTDTEELVAGSPSYMAPEQAGLGTLTVTHLADVWGLGATLYHMLTGVPPFRGATTSSVLDAVIGDELVPPSKLVDGVPSALDKICARAMRKTPGERFDSADAMADALAAFVEQRDGRKARGWLFRRQG